MKLEFESLSILYTAINDIDKIISRPDNDECKLDDVLQAVKEINKKDYDPSIEAAIIQQIRNAIEKMYIDRVKTINESIKITGDDLDKRGSVLSDCKFTTKYRLPNKTE